MYLCTVYVLLAKCLIHIVLPCDARKSSLWSLSRKWYMQNKSFQDYHGLFLLEGLERDADRCACTGTSTLDYACFKHRRLACMGPACLCSLLVLLPLLFPL